MEDLREEPELEEREEEEEEEEEEEDAQEPKTDECKDESQECQQDQAEKDENQEDASNDQDDELLIRPVRNVARRASLINELDPIDAQGLLETNFSVTGLNEIKTERITPRTNSSAFGGDAPKRPMSLDLNAPIAFRKLHGGARPEKFRTKLIDQSMLMK